MATRPGVPAWKRLGLKLKYANEQPENLPSHDDSAADIETTTASPKMVLSDTIEPPKKKRKTGGRPNRISDQPITTSDPALQGTDGNAKTSKRALKKQVSFATDTKSDPPTANGSATQSNESKVEEVQATATKKKSKKKSAKKSKQPAGEKSNTALDYLNQYHTARLDWKFNKNRETWILKHVLSTSDIPQNHDLALARYVHGLQGTAARERLKTQCLEKLKETNVNNTTDETENLVRLEQDEQHTQRFVGEVNQSPTSHTADEKDNDQEEDYHSWLRKQPRSKMLLWALGMQSGLLSSHGTEHTNGTDDVAKAKVKKKKKKKKKKNRTVVVDYDTSSSESDSSDSSSDTDTDSESGGMGSHSDETSSSGSDSDEDSRSSDSDSDAG